MWLFYYVTWWFWNIFHAIVLDFNCIMAENFVKIVVFWKMLAQPHLTQLSLLLLLLLQLLYLFYSVTISTSLFMFYLISFSTHSLSMFHLISFILNFTVHFSSHFLQSTFHLIHFILHSLSDSPFPYFVAFILRHHLTFLSHSLFS